MITFGLEIAPENAAGYELLARAYFQKGDLGQAAKCAQRSLELEPENPFLRQKINALGQE